MRRWRRRRQPSWRHGLSLFGEPKYPAGFKHFDYVNPAAPQGGMVRQIAVGTFDNFNQVVAGVKGSLALGLQLVIESLTTPAMDEVSTDYGLLAEAVSYPEDRSSVTYRLRANAHWQDGKPVTPEDVIYSFEAWKQNSPQLAAYYRHVTKADKSGERDVTFTFDRPGNRELPQIVGQLPVLPKHWWEGADAKGKKRDVTQTSLEPPLGSGPYRLEDFAPGRTIVYEKDANYWGKDLNVSIGSNNFGAGPLRILPRLHRGAGSLQGRPGRLAQREQRQELGDGLRFSGGARKEGGAGGIPHPQYRRDAGLRLQHPAGEIPATRACAAPSTSPSTSRR